jgi:hypothetical protein
MDAIKSFFKGGSSSKVDKPHKGEREACGERLGDFSPHPSIHLTHHSPFHQKTDKLAPTKAAERERKEAHKAELAAAKAAKAGAAREKAALFREERAANHDTGHRAAADSRRAAHKEKHAAGARVCEHGVSRCRICFPPDNGKGKR